MKYFITGTDTDIGKTYVTAGLLKLFSKRGYSTLGLKPIASGGCLIQNILCNEDVLALQESASIKLPTQTINPFLFAEPIAPHLAAEKEGIRLTVEQVSHALQKTFQQYLSETILIEGAGGWLVPLNESETMADLVIALKLPVILVVGMRLGCLNHALLTVEVMKQQGISLYGWIANCIDPNMLEREANIATLKSKIAAQCLGVIDFEGDCTDLKFPSKGGMAGEA